MHQRVMDAIIDELRIKQCLRDIAQYWAFRSTVPGPGLRRASEFLGRRHGEHGIEAEVIPYPADDRTGWLEGHKNPPIWGYVTTRGTATWTGRDSTILMRSMIV